MAVLPWRRANLAALGLVALLVASAAPAALTGPEILRRALDLQAGIKDYTATIRVTVDMPGIQIPERTAKLYFKRPDKVHLESKSLIMVPRKALVMGDLGSELARNARVILAGQAQRDGHLLYFLKLLPPEGQNTSDRILVWVRGDRFTIERLEVHSAGQRELAVQWRHQLVGGKFWMMQELSAELRGGRPGRRRGPPNPDAKAAPERTGPGTVTVQFSNLKVNIGLPDSLFVEAKK